MTQISVTERTRIVRGRKRARYDLEFVERVLDEAYVCHLAVAVDGAAVSIPTAHVRDGGQVYVHGSTKNRVLMAATSGADACLSVTLLDGLVLARSAFHHSMNYRSVQIYGRGRLVTDELEKLRVLDALVDKMAPERSRSARAPSPGELKATALVGFSLDEASAKHRQGGPVDEPEDLSFPVWAGVVPIVRHFEPAEAEPEQSKELAPPQIPCWPAH